VILVVMFRGEQALRPAPPADACLVQVTLFCETTMKIHVRLRPDWKGSFRRTIARDEKGRSTDVRVFNPGEIIQLPLCELPYVAADLGKALQPMEWSKEFGKFRPVEMDELDIPGMVDLIKLHIEEGSLAELEVDDEPEPEGASEKPAPAAKS